MGDGGVSYGGTLGCDPKQDTGASQFKDSDTRLVGAGRALVYDLTPSPGIAPIWTSYSVTPDDIDAWFVDTLGGTVATEADFLAVFADLENLFIRGEFVTGDDTGGIDNVVLTAKDADIRLLEDAGPLEISDLSAADFLFV